MDKTRILIADPHDLTRWGLAALLGTQPDLEVCGQTTSASQTVEAVADVQPDIVIIDSAGREMGGGNTLREIIRRCSGTELLVLTLSESEEEVYDALAAGARGYVLKGETSTDLLTAIRALARNQVFLTPKITELVIHGYLRSPVKPARAGSEPLTRREYQVIRLLAAGKSNKDVADVLGVTLRTAETHRANLMTKIGVHSLGELVNYAREHDLTEPPNVQRTGPAR